MGLLVTAGVMVAAFAWYRARDAASPDAGAYKNIYDVDVPQSAPIPVDYRLILLTPRELARPLWRMCLCPRWGMTTERLRIPPRDSEP